MEGGTTIEWLEKQDYFKIMKLQKRCREEANRRAKNG
jgi:hypothetical protein